MIELNALREFVLFAKQNTYTSSKDGDEKINDDFSREFQWRDGEFLYRDRYFGTDPFSGQEIVYYNESPIWSMNYYGNTTGEGIRKNEIYAFLRVALSNLDANYPFRGNNNFCVGKFRYANMYKGDFLHFSGHESIYYEEQLVYSLSYFGGLVSD